MTWEQVQTAGLVIFAVLGGIVTVIKAVEAIHGLFKPNSDRQQRWEKLFATDKARLDAHEKELGELREGQKVLCTGVQALLNHQLHDGNAEEMQEASSKMSSWLINR